MFANRLQAGGLLAEKLPEFRKMKDCAVLGIPRGGVLVAAEVSKSLGLPLSLMVVRKIGAMLNPELAVGAIGMDGRPYFNTEVASQTGATKEYLQSEAERQYGEVKRRMGFFRIKEGTFRGKTIILVDDGIATGSTVLAAIRILRGQKVRRLVLAVPVCSADTAQVLKPLVDRFVCLEIPPSFSAVGQFYSDYAQVADTDVKRIMDGR